MADFQDLLNSKTVPSCEGEMCIIRRAWNQGHRSISLGSLKSHEPASKAQMRNIAKALYVSIYRWQFRLLRILPSRSSDEPLKCELLVANIIEGDKTGLQRNGCLVDYDAISYCWGAPQFTTDVYCNGMMVPTTRNLAEALYHLRRPESDRYIWADAFCINQEDNREKSQQVHEIMFRIFEKARTVVCWLGPSTTPTYKLLNLLSLSSYDIFGIDRVSQHEPACSSIVQDCQQLANSLICSTPWFSRLWIRQELTAAQHHIMCCGAYTFEFLDIITLVTHPNRSNDQYHRRVFPSHVPISFTTLAADGMASLFPDERGRKLARDHYKGFPPFTSPSQWICALLLSLGFNVTLGVDMFYGLRNIVEKDVYPAQRVLPPTDYNCDWHSLYTNFMYKAISLGCLKTLDVFEDRTRECAPDLPSWMMDLRYSHLRLFINPSMSRMTQRKQSIDVVNGSLILRALQIGSVLGLVGETDRCTAEGIMRTGSTSAYCYGQCNTKFGPTLAGYTCDYGPLRSWSEILKVFPDVAYTFFWADTRLHKMEKSQLWQDMRQQKIMIIASKSVMPGDEIIRLVGSYSTFAHVVRRTSQNGTSSGIYIFLGVCVLWPEDADRSESAVEEHFELPYMPCDANIEAHKDFIMV